MAITVTLQVTPSAPNHGDTVTATYVVSGNTGTPAGTPTSSTIEGDATVGTDVVHVQTTITLPGSPAVPALSESFVAPTATGLTFVATGNPKVFTALVA